MINGLLVSLVAAWLSWGCSMSEGRDMIEAALWASLAFLFGGVYIVYYFLIREPWCRLSEKGL